TALPNHTRLTPTKRSSDPPDGKAAERVGGFLRLVFAAGRHGVIVEGESAKADRDPTLPASSERQTLGTGRLPVRRPVEKQVVRHRGRVHTGVDVCLLRGR